MDYLFLNNGNNYFLGKVRDETGELVSDATFTLELYRPDPEGTDGYSLVLTTGGADPGWPISFVSEGKGDYRVHVPINLDVKFDTEYLAYIRGTARGRQVEIERRVFVKRRF